MKAILLRRDREGNIIRKPVIVLSEPNMNGLIDFYVVKPTDTENTIPHVSGTCRIADIENGKSIWSNWPNNFLKEYNNE